MGARLVASLVKASGALVLIFRFLGMYRPLVAAADSASRTDIYSRSVSALLVNSGIEANA